MTLNEMRQWLAVHDLRLTRSLGQNFLHDAHQLRRIVQAAALQPGERVLEIGPGLGPLTELLAAQPVEVLAIEIDQRLHTLLQQRLGGTPNLVLLHADALAWLREESRDLHDWKLAANLPYSCASPMLVELALNPRGPAQMTVTLQLEVAQRLMARPATAAYGVLTLLLQLNYTPAGWFKIPAACFFPAPEVDSACVTLRRRPAPLMTESGQRVFVRAVKQGFSQRRKMLRKLLKAQWPEARIDEALTQLQLTPKVRAEELSLEQWVALASRLSEAHV